MPPALSNYIMTPHHGLALVNNWWALALRGAIGVLLGIFTFLVPGITLAALVILFGAYAIIDGIINLIGASKAPAGHQRWWTLVLEGVVGILAGILTFIWPVITTVVLVYLIAFWAIITGVLEIAAAIRLRKAISGEWILILLGVISIVFGVLLAAAPVVGAIVITFWFGIYAFVFGILLIVLAVRLHGWGRSYQTLPAR